MQATIPIQRANRRPRPGGEERDPCRPRVRGDGTSRRGRTREKERRTKTRQQQRAPGARRTPYKQAGMAKNPTLARLAWPWMPSPRPPLRRASPLPPPFARPAPARSLPLFPARSSFPTPLHHLLHTTPIS